MEKYRREVMTATVLGVTGKLQREDGITHIIADKLVDLTHMLQSMSENTKIARDANNHPRNLRWASPRTALPVQDNASSTTSRPTGDLDQLGSKSGSSTNNHKRLKIDSHDFH